VRASIARGVRFRTSPDHRLAVVVEESVLRYQLGSTEIMAASSAT